MLNSKMKKDKMYNIHNTGGKWDCWYVITTEKGKFDMDTWFKHI